MTLRRRRLLRAGGSLSVVLLAGCAGNSSGNSRTADRTPSATTSTAASTPTPTRLPEERHELPPGPKSPPEPPETWTEATAKRYAVTYEERRLYNSMWGGTVEEVTVGCSVQDVRAVRGGFRVVVVCQGAAYWGDDGLHGDYIGSPTVYFVGNETAILTEEPSNDS